MMTVVSLKKAKKHLTEITLDSGRVLSLDSGVAAAYAIREGDTLSEERLKELAEESELTRAKSRALWILDRSSVTEKALYDKLMAAGFSEKSCAAVLARFKELRLIDDEAFAERFAERCAESNISRREAYYKLREKGVDKELANAALDAAAFEEEGQIAALLRGKYRGRLEAQDGVRKVYAALIRKGFSFSAVKSALKAYSEELEYSED